MKLHTIGRALFGGYFIYSGINYLVHEKEIAGHARSKRIPSPDVAVIASGIALIAGGAGMALGLKPKVAAIPIVGFLAAVSPTIHNFWNDQDPNERQHNVGDFAKNLALLSGTLAVAGASGRRGACELSLRLGAENRPAFDKSFRTNPVASRSVVFLRRLELQCPRDLLARTPAHRRCCIEGQCCSNSENVRRSRACSCVAACSCSSFPAANAFDFPGPDAPPWPWPWNALCIEKMVLQQDLQHAALVVVFAVLRECYTRQFQLRHPVFCPRTDALHTGRRSAPRLGLPFHWRNF